MAIETAAAIRDPLGALGLKRGWVMALGIAMIVLGTIALGDTLTVTLISVLLLGWLLILSGVFHVAHLIRNTEARSFWHILATIVDFAAGIYLIVHPTLGALTLTLILAGFLLATGVMRLIGVFQMDLPHKFWPVVDGILSIVLGLLLWRHWPWTGLWFIGFAIALALIFRGWAWLMIAIALGGRARTTTVVSPQPA